MPMPNMLDGPRRPARSGTARSLIVLVHGYGASGDDLIDLADMMAGALPDTVFVAPHAVERMPFPGAAGYQWFPLGARDPEEYIAGTRTAAPVLDRFLDDELARHGLGPDPDDRPARQPEQPDGRPDDRRHERPDDPAGQRGGDVQRRRQRHLRRTAGDLSDLPRSHPGPLPRGAQSALIS